VQRWRARDPIEQLRRLLESSGVFGGGEYERLVREVREQVEEAVRFAEASPEPDPAALLEAVYA